MRAILEASFPEYAHLPLKFIGGGTDNWIFRVGQDMAIRLPQESATEEQNLKEQIFLNRLAIGLPLEISKVIAGVPRSEVLGRACYISSWLHGVTGTDCPELDRVENAVALGRWIEALRKHDVTDAPRPASHNFFRGNDLRERDAETRKSLEALPNRDSKSAAVRIWEEALEAVPAKLPKTWIHGDLQPSNVVLRKGRLTGIVDFGGMAVGDPACDLLACWTMFGESGRTAIRRVLNADEASWKRGMGWALTTAIVAYAHYRNRSRALTLQSLRTLDQLLFAEQASSRGKVTGSGKPSFWPEF